MKVPLRRPRRLTPTTVDVLIAALLLVELELESWLDTVIPARHRLAAAILVVPVVLTVLSRRRWPGPALLSCAAMLGILQTPPTANVLNGMTGTILPLILLSFTVGERLDARRGLVTVAVAIALLAGGAAWSEAGPPTGYSLGGELLSALVLPGASWMMGWLWGERNRREQAFRELVARVASDRELHERNSVTRERFRISRELQDVIAQNVSSIIIQAGGARQLIGDDPEQAVSAILAVERAGREALADLRRTLGLLRTGDGPSRLAPEPGLAQIQSLIAVARERGIECVVRTEGAPGRLPVGTDLVAYRALEATLGVSDAGRRPNEVLIVYGAGHLELEVRGVGRARALDEGLRDISDRVALYGGALVLTTGDEGRYTVGVRLPRKADAL